MQILAHSQKYMKIDNILQQEINQRFCPLHLVLTWFPIEIAVSQMNFYENVIGIVCVKIHEMLGIKQGTRK